MTLNAQIRETIQVFRDNFPSELNALIEQGAGEISALDIVEKALRIGDKAPDFSLKNRHGESRSLTEYLNRGPLVITFYRGAWCPYCNLQLAAYNARLDDIKAAGGTLVAITPEEPEGVNAFLESEAPQEAKDSIVDAPDFDVLHDKGNVLAKIYGLVFELPEPHKKLFELMKFDIEKANGDNSFTFPDPATYIIGTDGVIQWAFVPNNYRKRAEPEEIIQKLELLQTN